MGASYAVVTITEQKAGLERTNQLKSKYLSIVSHDLRTPITSLVAYGEIIRDEDTLDRAERRQFADVIIRESKRLSRLVTDLLDLDKIEAGKMEWRFEAGDIAETLHKNLALFQRLAEAEGVRFETVMADGCPPVVFDEDRISQVVTNILSNALKYTPTGGVITLRLAPAGEGVEIDIADTGPGIPEGSLASVFDRFAQARPEDGKVGTGLGLAIAKEIIERHGGRIWASNRPDSGAVFSFTLPALAT